MVTSLSPAVDGVARALFEASPVPTFVVDDDVRVLAMNGAAHAALAWGEDPDPTAARGCGEVLGCVNAAGPGGCGRERPCADCVIRGSVRQALTAGPVHRARTLVQLRRGDGVAEASFLVSAVRLGGGGAPRAVLALEDVSDVGTKAEVVRTLEQVAAEKERLRVTLASIGDAVVATDEAGRITLLNGVAEDLTGWRADDALGRPVDEVFRIIHESTRAPVPSPVEHALREGTVVALANHTLLVARDGTERPIADSAAPIRDAHGRTAGVVLVFRDQTKDREAERALRDSERRVRARLEAILSPEGDVADLELGDVLDVDGLRAMMEEFHALSRIPMAIIDVRGKVLVGVGWQDVCTKFHRAHPESCKHCIESDTTLSAGIPPGEIRRYRCQNSMWDVATPIFLGGHHAGNVFMGQFFFEDEPIDYAAFRAQAARYGFDERAYLAALDAVPRLSRRDVGAGMQFFLRFARMLSEASYGNLKLARTAAERDRGAASLRESKERLEESDRRKTEFLAVLSHELRNPLAPIRNCLYLLDRIDPHSDQALHARAVIGRQVRHLTRLVDDLLDVTRISHGKVALSRARLDLREVVRRACDDNRSAFESGELEMHLDLPFGPVWVDADETRMSQAVANLLVNAAKFTPAGGRVRVRVASAEDRAEIGVRDTGVGIDPRELERMFQPFEQADQGLARTQGGLGLGLALVKGLVELHGGTVRASSGGAGLGSEFVITLPLAAPTEAQDPPDVASGPEPSKLVLVVEDNEDAAETLAELLRLDGHRTAVARTGAAGIELAKALAPDVVLCDIGLPDVSGHDVARAIRRAAGGRRVPRLVALSGYAQPEDRQRALDAGFDAHVAKPPDLRELAAALADDPITPR